MSHEDPAFIECLNRARQMGTAAEEMVEGLMAAGYLPTTVMNALQQVGHDAEKLMRHLCSQMYPESMRLEAEEIAWREYTNRERIRGGGGGGGGGGGSGAAAKGKAPESSMSRRMAMRPMLEQMRREELQRLQGMFPGHIQVSGHSGTRYIVTIPVAIERVQGAGKLQIEVSPDGLYPFMPPEVMLYKNDFLPFASIAAATIDLNREARKFKGKPMIAELRKWIQEKAERSITSANQRRTAMRSMIKLKIPAKEENSSKGKTKRR